MVELCEKEQCTACYSCINACSTNSILMFEDDCGFIYPAIDKNSCNECGLCENSCPGLTEFGPSIKVDYLPTYYAFVNKDVDIVKGSSSGGAFSAMANMVLSSGGIVCGAVYGSEMRVVHTCVKASSELKKLRGAKYLLSEIGFNFREIRGYLKDGCKVLFVGTPCQVSGLKLYLNKIESENLITVDLICQGVGSYYHFRKYIDYLENKYKSKVININFRHKQNGNSSGTLVVFDNGFDLLCEEHENAFRYWYGSKLFYRESCYDCKYATIPRMGDITLGDFWGLEKHPIVGQHSGNGVSLVIVNNERGKAHLEMLKNSGMLEGCASDIVLMNCPNLIKSHTEPGLRKEFIEYYSMNNYVDVSKKYYKSKSKVIKIVLKSLKDMLGEDAYLNVKRMLGL